MGQNIN